MMKLRTEADGRKIKSKTRVKDVCVSTLVSVYDILTFHTLRIILFGGGVHLNTVSRDFKTIKYYSVSCHFPDDDEKNTSELVNFPTSTPFSRVGHPKKSPFRGTLKMSSSIPFNVLSSNDYRKDTRTRRCPNFGVIFPVQPSDYMPDSGDFDNIKLLFRSMSLSRMTTKITHHFECYCIALKKC